MRNGNKIKAARLAKGLSRHKLAILVRCHENTIAFLEDESRSPRYFPRSNVVPAVCRVLGLDAGDFL
jgi:DNA-binding XRE family transcriptional regulator